MPLHSSPFPVLWYTHSGGGSFTCGNALNSQCLSRCYRMLELRLLGACNCQDVDVRIWLRTLLYYWSWPFFLPRILHCIQIWCVWILDHPFLGRNRPPLGKMLCAVLQSCGIQEGCLVTMCPVDINSIVIKRPWSSPTQTATHPISPFSSINTVCRILDEVVECQKSSRDWARSPEDVQMIFWR